MKLDELRRHLRARKRTREEIADDMDAFLAEARLKLARCDCSHLVEEHSGPGARASLRDTMPSLPTGYCYHCSCARPNPTISEKTPWETVLISKTIGESTLKEDRDRYTKEVLSSFSDKFLGEEPEMFKSLPTLKDATRGDIEGSAHKLLGSYAFYIPDLFGPPVDGDLVRVVGWFWEAGELKFTVWKGERDAKRSPINMDAPADRLFVVDCVVCSHCSSGVPSRYGRPVDMGIRCRNCDGLGRVISSKSAKLFRVTE